MTGVKITIKITNTPTAITAVMELLLFSPPGFRSSELSVKTTKLQSA